MQTRPKQNFFHIAIFVLAGILLSACETVDIKPAPKKDSIQEIEDKKTVEIDLKKLELDEIHKLPQYIECRSLLEQAAKDLKKRPVVSVKVESINGYSDDADVANMYYLQPVTDKYPLDASIRDFVCPKTINDVKVTYQLLKGPSYKPWYYFSYYGEHKGIDTSSPTNPKGNVVSRFGDKPPEINLHIDKLEIVSLKPEQSFSDEDLEFTINNFTFDSANGISFNFHNKGKKDLAIRKFDVTLGSKNMEVDFKKSIINLPANKMYSRKGVNAGHASRKWFVTDANKAVRLKVSVIYKADWTIKKLFDERYIRIRDLGINQ